MEQAFLREIAEINLVSHPYESVRGDLSFFEDYRSFSSHNYDLMILFAIYFLVFLVAAVAALFSFASRDLAEQLVFGAAIFGGLITISAKLIESSQKRLATVDLFASEILSIGRVFVSINIVGSFIHLFEQLSKETSHPDDHSSAEVKNGPPGGPQGFADAARKESYFTIFEKNNADLGPLAADIISDVTAFYTFLKASRDATGSMSLWKESYYNGDMRRNDIISIIYNCFLMAIHGRKSLCHLIEEKNRVKYAVDVFNSIELKCYCFLLTVLEPLDPRFRLLSERRDFYMNVIKSYAGAAGSAGSMERLLLRK
jgi:hypothetical protein